MTRAKSHGRGALLGAWIVLGAVAAVLGLYGTASGDCDGCNGGLCPKCSLCARVLGLRENPRPPSLETAVQGDVLLPCFGGGEYVDGDVTLTWGAEFSRCFESSGETWSPLGNNEVYTLYSPAGVDNDLDANRVALFVSTDFEYWGTTWAYILYIDGLFWVDEQENEYYRGRLAVAQDFAGGVALFVDGACVLWGSNMDNYASSTNWYTREVDDEGILRVTHHHFDGVETEYDDYVYTKYTVVDGALLVRRVTKVEADDEGWRVLTTIYVYHGEAGNSFGKLEYVVEPEGVARYLAANPTKTGVSIASLGNQDATEDSPLSVASDLDDPSIDWSPYASIEYGSYDAQGRVLEMKGGAGGCGGCSEAGVHRFAYGTWEAGSAYSLGEYVWPTSPNGFYYECTEAGTTAGTEPSWPTPAEQTIGDNTVEWTCRALLTGWNEWQTYRRTATPSGMRKVEFVNQYGDVVYEVVQEMTGSSPPDIVDDNKPGSSGRPHYWITHYTYDDDGRLLEHRHPSACEVYSAVVTSVQAGLEAMRGEWVTAVSPSDNGMVGLVQVYTWGMDDGCWWECELVREGTKPTGAGGHSEYYVAATKYGDGDTFRPRDLPWETYAYPDGVTTRDDASRVTTQYMYVFWANTGDTRMTVKKVEHPVVPEGENGPGGEEGTAIIEHYAWVLDYGTPVYSYNDWTTHEDGSLSYTQRDEHGNILLEVQDVDTSEGEVANWSLPNEWETPEGMGLHFKTEYAYTDAGLLSTITYPDGRKECYYHTHCYDDANRDEGTTTCLATLVAPHMDSQSHYDYAPTQITVTDLAGRTIVAAAGVSDTAQDGDLSNDWDPTGTVSSEFSAFDQDENGFLCARTETEYTYDANGALENKEVTQWVDADDTDGDTYTTTHTYDPNTGRSYKIEAPDGTITWTEHDQLGRSIQTWMGTNDTEGVLGDPNGSGLPNTMVKIGATFYDEWDGSGDPAPGSGTSGVGDGNATQTRAVYGYTDPNDIFYKTVHKYDWRNRLEQTQGPDNIVTKRTLDNLGRASRVDLYEAGDTDFIKEAGEDYLSVATTDYDTMGRVWRSRVYAIVDGDTTTPGDLTASQTLTARYWYDARGRLIKSEDPNGLFEKTDYDGVGWAIATYLSYEANETSNPTYGAADDVDGDTVIEETVYDHDDGGRVIQTTHYRRTDSIDEDDKLGALSIDWDFEKSRQTFVARWYDEVGRLTCVADYGTYNNEEEAGEEEEFERPAAAPSIPGDANEFDYNLIVAKYEYDDAGRLEYVYDNKNKKTYREYDDLGRVTEVVENHVNGTLEADKPDEDRTTTSTFDAKGRLAYITALKYGTPTNEEQKTYYMYGDTVNASLPTAVIYPDTQDTVSFENDIVTVTSGTDHVATTYDRLARKVTVTDQGGLIHAYDYIGNATVGAGRLEKDRVTNNVPPGYVDLFVRSLKYGYDGLGRIVSATSYNSNICTLARNQVVFAYDGWGNVATTWECHTGVAVTTGDDAAQSPHVHYTYEEEVDDNKAKYVRLDKVTYPNRTREVYYNYASTGVGAPLSRLDNIANNDGGAVKYAQYAYLGAGTVVEVNHPAVGASGLKLSYKASGGRYPGFDRFGRVAWQQWTDGSTVLDRYFYGYDRAGNRTWRAERINPRDPSGRDEAYQYDGLHRLVKAQRGVLVGTGAGVLRAPIGGDATCDGVIDASDYALISPWFNNGGDEWREGDFNDDGVLDANDADIIDRNFLFPPARAVSRTWQWTLDALGNWVEYKEDVDEAAPWVLDQDRMHNKANEIADTDGSPDNPITEAQGSAVWYDAWYHPPGDMSRGPNPVPEGTNAFGCGYDAWHRVVWVRPMTWTDADADGVVDSGETTAEYLTAKYQYDALGRRIRKYRRLDSSYTNWGDYDYYYNTSWQVLEERYAQHTRSATSQAPAPPDAAHVQYVWDIRYIDAPVLRWRDSDGDEQHTLDETLYFCNDANMNVTALVDGTTGSGTFGQVVERYQYDPYGKPTFLQPDWSLQEVEGQPDGAASAFANEILFCGYRYNPEMGLYHVRNREYHPTLGRWLQRDPIGYADGYSLYLYVSDSPAGGVDPMGLWGDDVHHDLTLQLADMARISCPEAIAEAALRPDKDRRRAGGAGVYDYAREWPASSAMQKLADMRQWHFPADPDGIIRPNSSAARGKVEAGFGKCDIDAFGEGLHVLQDSWAHQGRPLFAEGGVGHWRDATFVSGYRYEPNGQYVYLSAPHWEDASGTAWAAGPLGHADDAAYWPEDAVATGVATYDWIVAFKKKCACACPAGSIFQLPGRPTSMGPSESREQVREGLKAMFHGIRGDGRNVTDTNAIKEFGPGG